MQNSSTALELSPIILAYTEKLMTNIPKEYLKATTGDQMQRQAAIQQLGILVQQYHNTLLPELNKNIGQLEQTLQKAGIEF